MNTIQGTISNIHTEGQLTLIKIKSHDTDVTALMIDAINNELSISEGDIISVVFKETEVIIATGSTDAISMQNKFTGVVKTLEKGSVLSKLGIQCRVGLIHSIITSNAVKQLNISIGSAVTAMIKTNEIMLMK